MSEAKTLGNQIQILSGFPFPSAHFTSERSGKPIIRIRDLQQQSPETYFAGNYDGSFLISEGDVLVGMDGDFNAVKWQGPQSLLNQRVCKITTKDSAVLDQDFLYYSLQPQLNRIHNGTAQTTVKHLSSKDLYSIDAELPPLPEQKKIAEILSGIDKAIGARTNSAELTGKVSRFIADELFQQARIDHDSIQIGKCTRRLWQGINTAADKVVYHETGIPILQAKHITGGQVEEEGARRLSEDDYLRYSERYQPSAGDILFTNIGTIGKSALVPERSKFLIAWNIFLISPNERVVSEYLHYYLQVLDHRNYFHEHAAGNATKFINKTLISELEIPMPPLERQKKICDQIRALKDAEQRNRSAAAKYSELKKSLSIDLLSGRKRVSI